MYLKKAKTIVIKIGSSIIIDENKKIRKKWLTEFAKDIKDLLKQKKNVILVSSGAIALGRKKIKTSSDLTLADSQAMAAHGQIELMSAWKRQLNKFSVPIGQMLLTPRDTEIKLASQNAKQTVTKLIQMGCLPIINENDSTATDEIKFGDNDLLAAKVAKLVNADLLVILSTIDGLYTSQENIHSKKSDALITEVSKINAKIKKMAGEASHMGKGGMISKIEAAEICLKNDCVMVITSGNNKKPIKSLSKRKKSTWFMKK